jgi:hypothetical protein
MPAPWWRRRATCCVNSSARRSWGCRCSKRRGVPCRFVADHEFLRHGSARRGAMSRTIWVGAVAYDPKVVPKLPVTGIASNQVYRVCLEQILQSKAALGRG